MCLKEKPKNIEHKTKDELAQEIEKNARELSEMLKEIKLEQNLIEFEFIKQQGRYNVQDENVRKLMGISKENLAYIIEHYDELMKKYPNTKKQVQLRLDYIKSANIAKIIAVKGCSNCIEVVCKKLDVNIDDLCEECKKKVEPYINNMSKMYSI